MLIEWCIRSFIRCGCYYLIGRVGLDYCIVVGIYCYFASFVVFWICDWFGMFDCVDLFIVGIVGLLVVLVFLMLMYYCRLLVMLFMTVVLDVSLFRLLMVIGLVVLWVIA